MKVRSWSSSDPLTPTDMEANAQCLHSPATVKEVLEWNIHRGASNGLPRVPPTLGRGPMAEATGTFSHFNTKDL